MNLYIADDFDLEKIADSGQCFRWERLSGGKYRILNGEHCVVAEAAGEGQFSFSCKEAEFDAVWRSYFDLEENYAAIRGRIDPGRDRFLWTAAEQGKGIRILRQDPWETLVTFIISQNRNIPAIRRSVEMLCEACGVRKTDSFGRDYYAFPAPDAVAALQEEQLRACRLGYRCRYVHLAAEAVAAGDPDLKALMHAGEEETIRTLTKLTGVGVKVANCVSLFGFHHLNAFPKDVWIRRVLETEYRQGYPYEDYSPYNGIYQQYLFFRARKTAGNTVRKAAQIREGEAEEWLTVN